MENHVSNYSVALMLAALRQGKLSSLSEILKIITKAASAYGCILWQEVPAFGSGKNIPSKYLFVLADWFEDNKRRALHNLPLNSSATGSAVLNKTIINIPDISKDDRIFAEQSFLHRFDVGSMCSIPIQFLDFTSGAVNLYRKTPGPFNTDELAEIEQLASLIPDLYQALRDKVSLNLIERINERLHDAELSASDTFPSKEDMKEVIQTICSMVADSFQCLETSIFLENRLESPQTYELLATTWHKPFKKAYYKKSIREGLTGWALAHAKTVRIFDLAHFERDREAIRQEYPGIDWKDSLGFGTSIRASININADQPLPIISFMAAPILSNEKVIGVIRCSVPKQGPYYFSERDLDLLKLVASQIAGYWANWLARRESQEEILSWQNLVNSIGKLNSFVHNELTREVPDESRIFAEALRVTNSVINGAEIMDIRLLDEETHELYFTEVRGKFWNEGNQQEIQERKQRRFPIDNEASQSAGAFVFKAGKVYIIPNVQEDAYYSETFPGTTRMIVAPIQVEDKKFGVLDIRGTGKRHFPRQAETIAELLGQQLGLYGYLAAIIGQLRKVIETVNRLQEQQILTLEDFEHQLKSPINQVYLRVQMALKDVELLRDGSKLEYDLLAIRGLFRKIKRVTTSTGLFAEIANKKPILPKHSAIQYDSLIKLLIEAANDSLLMVEPRRRIKFNVDRKSFDSLRSIKVEADLELLEQAIMNILDNAAKYSFPETNVQIYGGLTKTRRFHISIANKGLPIRPHEVRLCFQRGWRSEHAQVTTGEGSGIGLWIVDHIMKAHEGELIVVPTTSDGITEVKLVFPSIER